ncbi:MAG TPA: fibronectin-binding domain-containing protein [Nanoarchaeota archaeon]|nr:fibronectin-binding domain-containing protein [Nanoarchaeota archaeon]
MPREMTSLDLKYAVEEMKVLEGGRIEKIYQKDKQIRIKVYTSQGEKELFFEPGKFFLTEYKRTSPEHPPSFCMLLRKHLMGKRILWIRQKGFERIVELETQDKILIFEIFSRGNVILCEKDYTIIMPLEVQLWKDREILPRKVYKFPPEIINPFTLELEEFKNMIKGQKKIASLLATQLSLGGIYAEEVCIRAGVEKSKKCSELSEEEKEKLFEALNSLKENVKAYIVFENNEPKDFAPFELKLHENSEKKYFESFNNALDEYYTYFEIKQAKSKSEKQASEEEEKLKRIIERQKEVIKNLEEMEEKARKKAEILFNNLDLVERIFQGLKKARANGLSWEEIKERISFDDSLEARSIKEIKEHEGKILLNINNTDIEVDFTISAIENAQRYYENAKRYKKKIEIAKQKIEEIKNRIKAEKQKKKQQEIKLPVKKKPKKYWYEKFRYSLTSEGFLVVAGKDATQNEILYKKYLEKDDIVLHADIHGAPLTIVKAQGRKITPLAVREAAEIAAAYSSAWKLKLGSVDVYWVYPEQVSKTPPAGQYLPKGAFMIYGQKNYLRKTEVKISIGVILNEEPKVYAGSVLGARAHCKYFLTIFPGDIPKNELAKKIKLKLMQKALPEDKVLIEAIPDEEFLKVIPGSGNIIG